MRRKPPLKIKKREDSTSIFKEYYSDIPFYDKFIHHSDGAVDVIIPIIHTNELWEANLKSFYREIPINRLLIGDGGCIDDSLKIVKKFPRVKIFNHKKYVSLGYSIRKLIEEVKTEWFIYPHSDVYLPKGWFEKMRSYQPKLDWFGCPQRFTVLAEYDLIDKIRPYAGSQMGRKEAFLGNLNKIDDDYVYRQEDFVFTELVEKNGFKHGKVEDTFHYHQMMHKKSPFGRKIKNVKLEVEIEEHEKLREVETQARGVVKYLKPTGFLQACVESNLIYLIEKNKTSIREFKQWAKDVNPEWANYIKPYRIVSAMLLNKITTRLKKTFNGLRGNRRRF